MLQIRLYYKLSRWPFIMLLLLAVACSRDTQHYAALSDLEGGKTFAVPTGTVADQFVSDRFPDAKNVYYNTVLDCVMAVRNGQADAAVYDKPVLKNIAARYPGLLVLDELLSPDNYGFAVRLSQQELKQTIDQVLADLKADGTYQEMTDRWLPEKGSPGPMPVIAGSDSEGVLRLGTAAVTEPMSYYAENREITGFDVEFALRVADRLNMRLEVIDMEFGALLPALISGKVDMVGAGLSITEERAKSVLFSEPYYESGIAALVSVEPGAESSKKTPVSFFKNFSERFYSNIILESRYKLILRGLYVTVLITVLAAMLGTIMGGILCFMRMSQQSFINGMARWLISLIRGTPVLVFLMITYYVIFASVNINPVIVAVIAFGINFAAYVSEMFRTSIESIDPGQREAGIASGFTGIQTFVFIIAPQALQRVLPVYKGEFISLLKMTSVVGYIAVQDLTKASDIIRSRTFDAFFPLLMAAVIYIMLAWALTLVLDRLQINVNPNKRRIRLMKEAAK